MKTSLRLLAAAFALLVSASAFAQSTNDTPPAGHRHFGPPPGSVVNADGTITLPDGTVVQPPILNADGTITLPDGTIIDPSDLPPPPPHRQPPVKNADGSITLPDGTVVQPNTDGTYTLPNGHVIDLTKAPPAGGRGPGGPGGHRGPPPSGG